MNAPGRIAAAILCAAGTLAVAVMLVNLTRYERAEDCGTPTADVKNCILHESAVLVEGPKLRTESWCAPNGGCNSYQVYDTTLRTAGGRLVKVELNSRGSQLRPLEKVVLARWDGRPIGVNGQIGQVSVYGWSPRFTKFSLIVAVLVLPLLGALALFARRWPRPRDKGRSRWVVKAAGVVGIGLVFAAGIGVVDAVKQMGLLAWPG